MFKQNLLLFTLALLLCISFAATGQTRISTDLKVDTTLITKVEAVAIKDLVLTDSNRLQFTQLLAENPNYFGTAPESLKASVKRIQYNTGYEELKDVGLDPGSDLLEAFVEVKKPYGFKGSLCSLGSYEYVRFYVDWNGDGDYMDRGEDLGLSSVNVHDIPDYLDSYATSPQKPLAYSVFKQINPQRFSCPQPYLVKVRAIVSWEQPPTAGNPGFIPVWGNVIERWVQIRPRYIPVLPNYDFAELLQPDWVIGPYPTLPPLEKAPELVNLSPDKLQQLYLKENVSPLRFNYEAIYQEVYKSGFEQAKVDYYADKYKLDPNLLVMLSDTSYEQLKAVGLEYDTDLLAAAFTIKRPSGYSGALCYASGSYASGSYEYISFWLYVYNSVLGSYSWKFVDTAKLNVHDIANIPAGGLEYAVKLPVDLSPYRDKCSNEKVIKVRAILSWGAAHNSPYTLPKWGNRKDTFIQVKPRQYSTYGHTPYIEVVGGMDIERISGNSGTMVPSTLGDGYANGLSKLGNFTAYESPFGGLITINGLITNLPDLSLYSPVDDPVKLRYKIQYRKDGSTNWNDITTKYTINVDTYLNGLKHHSEFINQEVNTDGYYTYHLDDQGNLRKIDLLNVLGVWNTKTQSEGDGLYTLRVRVQDPSSPTLHYTSNSIKVVVDNTKPQVSIALKAGLCHQYSLGTAFVDADIMASDLHIWKYTVSTTPYSLAISPSNLKTQVYTGVPGGTLNPPGIPLGEMISFVINNSTLPCGYVAYIRAWDRAIINNYRGDYGNSDYDDAGFCIIE